MGWFFDIGMGYVGTAGILTLFVYALFAQGRRDEEELEAHEVQRRMAARRLSAGTRDRAYL
jgi:hypothetical protein